MSPEMLAAEVLAGHARLARLYNAMCGAMANWQPPDPGDKSISDTAWESESKERERIRSEMVAVLNESPGVLYQAGPGVPEALEHIVVLRLLAMPSPLP